MKDQLVPNNTFDRSVVEGLSGAHNTRASPALQSSAQTVAMCGGRHSIAATGIAENKYDLPMHLYNQMRLQLCTMQTMLQRFAGR